MDKIEGRMKLSYIWKILKMNIHLLILVHWNACLYFSLSSHIGIGSDDWVVQEDSPKEMYKSSFLYSFFVLTLISETELPENDIECLYTAIVYMFGVVITAVMLGEVDEIILRLNAGRNAFRRKVDSIKSYMQLRNVDKELQRKVIRWFELCSANNQDVDESALDVLPRHIREEIATQVHMETLRFVKIFRECDPRLLNHLVTKLKLKEYAPNDFVFKAGDVGQEMFIVKSGQLEVLSKDGSLLGTLRSGSVFGELSILKMAGSLAEGKRYNSVRCVGYVDAYSLISSEFWEVLQDFPESATILLEKGRQQLIRDGLFDEEKRKAILEEEEELKERVKLLESEIENITRRMASFLGGYYSYKHKITVRLQTTEKRLMVE